MTSSEESREEFRTYMTAVNRTTGTHDDRHLSEAFMIAYYRGEVSEAERESAQGHLVGCEQCIALFRSTRDFLEPASASDEGVTVAETNEAWLSVLQRVAAASPADSSGAGATVVPAEFQRSRDRKLLSDSRLSLALAASLLISFSALGWLGWRLWQERESRRQSQEVARQLESKQRELEQRLSQLEQSGGDQLRKERELRAEAEAERDQLHDQLAALQPDRIEIPTSVLTLSSERGSQQELTLKFTAAKAVRVQLIKYKPYEFPKYAIEVLDERGGVVWERSGIEPKGAEGRLTLVVNRAKFRTGNYRLRLFGQQGNTRQQLGEYSLSVTVR